MIPAQFIPAMLPGAQAANASTGVPVGMTIAQAAVESAWGTKAPGNNLFGIKDDPSWNGPTVEEMTHEVINGERTELYAKFRAYPDFQGSLIDHAQFLKDNPRYAACFGTTDSCEFARRMAAAGYATDPNYANTICEIINAHDLTQYDDPLTTA